MPIKIILSCCFDILCYNIFPFSFRSHENPKPPTETLSDGRDLLHCALLDHLKSKSILPTCFSFRHDVFKYLFKNRGSKSNDKGHILLEKQDFYRCNFPSSWYQLVDSIGDGVEIDFPVKARLFLSWSPKNHELVGESMQLLPRYRPEKLSLSFCKKACSKS